MRWQHPRLGLLGPDDFIPIAEESDLIVKLGSQVLTRAVEDAAQWHKLLPRQERPLFVSVNVSSRQLFRADLVQEIRQVIGRALVPPGALRLEMTETLVMENPERAVEVLEQLRSAGAGLVARRFRYGIFVARLPQPLPVRHDQDRPRPRASEHGRRQRCGDRALDRGADARARQEGRSRGRRAAVGCRLPALDRLRVRAGLLLRRADRPARGRSGCLRAIRKNEKRMQRVGLFRTATKRKAKSESKPVQDNVEQRPDSVPSMSARGC